jgi:hypothetical protein
MSEENVTPEISEQLDEAQQAHDENAAGTDASGGEGNAPEGTGYAPPDTGQGGGAESEIPVGVDAIEPKESPADSDAGASGDNAPLDLADMDTGDPAGGPSEDAGA